MPHSLRSFVVGAVALLLVACDVRVGDKGVSLGVSGGKATDTWTRSYSLPAGGRLEVINANGPIEVSAAAGPGVEVRAEREAMAFSDEAAREALQAAEIIEQVAADHVTVEVRRNRDGRSGAPRRRGQVTVRYFVRLPPGLDATFKNENGPVRLENVQGRLRVNTTNASITASGVSGAIHVATVNGGIQLQMKSVTDAIELSVVNGGIRLELPLDAKADILASAVNGTVSVDDAFKMSRDASEGGGFSRDRVAGALNGGGPKVTAQSTNGGVRINVPGSRSEAARGR